MALLFNYSVGFAESVNETPAAVTVITQDDIEELPKIEVLGHSSLVTPSIEEARAELARVPGATTLITAEEFKTRKVSNIADVLKLSPGVFTQSRYGGSETRISIRGSGINQTFGARGIRFLRDGLPVTNASGFTNPELIDPTTAYYVEVLRGANALEYGAATLGGAVNFVSRTGRNSPGLTVRYEMDTEHNFYRPQILGGGMIGEDMDYFVSLSGLTDDGFRDQSHEEVLRGFGNFGIRWNDTNETRIFFTASDNRLELPGSLRKAQLNDDPSQTSGGPFDYGIHNGSRNLVTYRTEIKHTVLLSNESKLDIGAWYENRDLDHPLPFLIIDSESNETGASARFENTTQILGKDNRFIAGGLWAWGDSEGKNYDTAVDFSFPFTGGEAVKQDLRSTTADESYTLEWFFENQHALTPDLNLVLGNNVVHAKRRSDENFIDPMRADSNNSKYYTGFSPKAGLVWQAHEDVQLFTNVSRSYEVPTTLEFDAGVDAGNGVLDAQEAITVEVGTRGSYDIINWDLAFYHAWLHDEILTREDPNSPGQSFAQNAKNTTHLGVEIGVNASIPLGILGDDMLDIRTVYNFTKFEFDNDSQFGDNKIPSIPENFGTVELLYQHPSGFYIGPNVQYADNYYVDYANTQKADAYTILGLRSGYTYNDRYTVFFEGRNLTDRKYISNTGVEFNANGGDPRQFNPGPDRNFFFGFSVDFL